MSKKKITGEADTAGPLGLTAALQAQWDNVYGPTPFGDPNNLGVINATHFTQRVAMAVAARAWAVSTEGVSVTQHTLRAALATKVLNDPLSYMMPFAHALSSQQIDMTSDDGTILGMVANAWNGFAGVP